MLKSEFISLVHHALDGGAPPAKSKYHPRVIEQHLSLAYNEVVSQIKDVDILDQLAVVRRNVPVLFDEGLALYYSDLPLSLLNTIYGSALRMVAPMKDQNATFFLRKNHSQATMSRLDVSSVLSNNTVRIEGQRIYYDKFDTALQKKGVLIKLLAGFDDLDEDDNIDMPGGKDSMIFRLVMEQMGQMIQTPKSYRNNNNANDK